MLDRIIVTEIKNAVLVTSHKGQTETMTFRKTYGLSFCLEGQITYVHNGKSFVSDKNHAVFLPQGQSYTIYRDKNGVFPLINFTAEGFFMDTFRVIPITNASSYIRDFERIKSLLLFDGTRAKKLSIFYGIIAKLKSEVSSQSSILSPALSYITENFSDPCISNSDISKKCNISEVYLRKLFLNQLNTTPKQYIIELRINKAKQLLSDGVMKAGEVAEKCGFSNPYHFSRVFKEHTGLSPTEYIKQNRIYKI